MKQDAGACNGQVNLLWVDNPDTRHQFIFRKA